MDRATRPSKPLLCTLAILAVALLTVMVRTNPGGAFDADPRLNDPAIADAAIGPAALAWINVLLAALCAVALRLHGHVMRWPLVLAALGAAGCAYHMTEHAIDLHRGATWIAGITVAVTMMHLAQRDDVRRWLVAALMALAAVYLIEAVVYVLYEHPLTIEHFRRNMEDVLHARGIEPGSAHEELYIRRMESPDATGPVGLSNVFGSLAGALALLSIAVSVPWVRRRQWRIAWAPLVAAAAGLITVLLTRSKGAALTVVLCVGLLAVTWRKPRIAPPLAVALVALAVIAVLVRGAMGPPETWEGERSILFRFHYWQAAVAALADAPPLEQLLGLGVDGFKQAYLVHKNPINPENVISTHNVLIDFTVMLGIGGLLWCALLIASLCRWREPRPADETPPQPPDTQLPIALALTAVIFTGVVLVEGVMLLAVESFLAFAFSAITFVALTAVLATPGWVDRRAASIGLFAAASVLLVHNQIEMTFFTDGAVYLAMLIIGAAAAPTGEPAAPRKPVVAPALLLIAAIALAAGHAVPVTRQQAALGEAVATLRRADQTRSQRREQMQQQLQRGVDADTVLQQEVAAWRDETQSVNAHLAAAHAVLPIDPGPTFWRARLLLEDAHVFRQMRQSQAAADAAFDALVVLDEAAPPDDLSAMRLRARVFEFMADLRDAPDWRRDAVAVWRRVLERSPYSLRDHLHLADLYWEMGEQQRARDLYEGCMTLHEQAYLDPATQMDADTREKVRNRLAP